MMLGNCNIVIHAINGSEARQMSSGSVVHFETSTKNLDAVAVTLVSLSNCDDGPGAHRPALTQLHMVGQAPRNIPLQVRRLPRSGEEEAARFQIATSSCSLVFIATYLFTRH
jgi:hypothetical protein